MSLYNVIRNLSVAVLLTTSISFAMDDEGKNSDDVHKARLRESFSDGIPLLTMGDMAGLPLLSSGGLDHAALAALFGSTESDHAHSSPAVSVERREPAYNPADFDGMPLLTLSAFPNLSSGEAEAFRSFFESTSSVPVVSTRLAFEETSEQTIARTTVSASFVDSLLEVSGGYVVREDLDESESTSDQARHIVISLVNRINILEASKVYARECASAEVTYTQEQVNDMFVAYASLGMTLPSADNV